MGANPQRPAMVITLSFGLQNEETQFLIITIHATRPFYPFVSNTVTHRKEITQIVDAAYSDMDDFEGSVIMAKNSAEYER